MLRIDKAILDTNGVICGNISQLSSVDRGLLSQNILSQIRNFVEYIAIKACSNGQDVDPNDYNLNVAALKYIQRRGDLRFLYRFHEMLHPNVKHKTQISREIFKIFSDTKAVGSYSIQKSFIFQTIST